MAKNLRTKIPADDVLMIQDVNTAATKQFVDEMSSYQVVIADSPRQVAEKAVCQPFLHLRTSTFYDEYVCPIDD
jgi:hypothetical protein